MNRTHPNEAHHFVSGTVPFRLGWLGFSGVSTLTINLLLTEPHPLRQHHSRAKVEVPLQIVTFSTSPVALNFLPQHLNPEISPHEFPQELFNPTANRLKPTMLHLFAVKVL